MAQEDLAADLNISAAYIGQVESPNFRAKYKTLHLNELAKLFGCSPRDFWPEKALWNITQGSLYQLVENDNLKYEHVAN